MVRYTVLRPIKFKGRVYEPGEYLPENFTAKDKERHLWSRKIIAVEVPDIEVATVVEDPIVATEDPQTPSENIETPSANDEIDQKKEAKICGEEAIKNEFEGKNTSENLEKNSPKVPVKQVSTKK